MFNALFYWCYKMNNMLNKGNSQVWEICKIYFVLYIYFVFLLIHLREWQFVTFHVFYSHLFNPLCDQFHYTTLLLYLKWVILRVTQDAWIDCACAVAHQMTELCWPLLWMQMWIKLLLPQACPAPWSLFDQETSHGGYTGSMTARYFNKVPILK